MYWKTPPTKPGEIISSYDRAENVFVLLDDPAAMRLIAYSARVVFGSCDMNENHGMIEGLSAQEIPIGEYMFEIDGALRTYLFHRTEILGDVLSHVYLHDEGGVPVSIQANELISSILLRDEPDSAASLRDAQQVAEAASIDAKNRRSQLPALRASLKPLLSDIEQSKRKENPSTKGKLADASMRFINRMFGG